MTIVITKTFLRSADDRRPCFDCGRIIEWNEKEGDWFHLGENHLAGTEECACRECESEDCDVVVNTKETTMCTDCEDEGGE